MPDIPTMTECLQDSPDPHTNTGDARDTLIAVTPMTNNTIPLYSPNQSTGRGDADMTSAATLRQSAEEVVLHPNTTSSATCLGTAHLPLPSMRPFKPQTPRVSSDDTVVSYNLNLKRYIEFANILSLIQVPERSEVME